MVFWLKPSSSVDKASDLVAVPSFTVYRSSADVYMLYIYIYLYILWQFMVPSNMLPELLPVALRENCVKVGQANVHATGNGCLTMVGLLLS